MAELTIPVVQPLTPSIEPYYNLQTSSAATTSFDYLQQFGSTLFQTMSSIPSVTVSAFVATDAHLRDLHHSNTTTISSTLTTTTTSTTSTTTTNNINNLNGSNELQKQLEYDKFMNEIWIGIVLTLIFISLIFCICSCLLYHQFRTWKRNYHRTLSQSLEADIEALKCQQNDFEDPVPEYTLVSGLPTYEAALELLQCKKLAATTTTTTTTTTIATNVNINNTGEYVMHIYPNVMEIFNNNNLQQQETIDITEEQDNVENTSPLLMTKDVNYNNNNNNTNNNTVLSINNEKTKTTTTTTSNIKN